ncbi:MAG: hypothetical protein ACI81R_001766 [Bradymonadia bacterium]|jgi:hypothetical protein
MNMMSKRQAARRRALRAVQAVSIGGVAFVAQGCGSDASGSDDNDDVTSVDGSVTTDVAIDVPELDISVDTVEDVGEEVAEDVELDSTEPDVSPDVDPPDDVTADVGEEVSEDVAPDAPEDVRPDAPEPDVAQDVAPDAPDDTVTEVTDGGDSCEDVEDNQCPDECTQDNDFDCCQRFIDETGAPCFYDPGFGCNCAAVGPFNPPAFDGRVANRES